MLDFTNEDAFFLNQIVFNIIEAGKFRHKKLGKIKNNLKRYIDKLNKGAVYEKLETKTYEVFHYIIPCKDQDIMKNLFIHMQSFFKYENNEINIGELCVEFIKREKSKFSLFDSISPESKKELKSNSITLYMIRQYLVEEIKNVLENLDKELCIVINDWFIAGYMQTGSFIENKSKLLIPFPIILYRSKKSYHQEPKKIMQIDCHKLFAPLFSHE